MIPLLNIPLIQNFAIVCKGGTFLGLIPWYQYLTITAKKLVNGTSVCEIQGFMGSNNNPGAALGNDLTKTQSPFLSILLAIIEDLLRVAALVALGYVIYGGFRYQTSNGDSNAVKSAQQTVTNALVGLAIAILAAGIVNYIGNQLGKG